MVGPPRPHRSPRTAYQRHRTPVQVDNSRWEFRGTSSFQRGTWLHRTGGRWWVHRASTQKRLLDSNGPPAMRPRNHIHIHLDQNPIHSSARLSSKRRSSSSHLRRNNRFLRYLRTNPLARNWERKEGHKPAGSSRPASSAWARAARDASTRPTGLRLQPPNLARQWPSLEEELRPPQA